jgi:archaellum component FlaC
MGPKGVPVRASSSSRRAPTHPFLSPLRIVNKRSRGPPRSQLSTARFDQMEDDSFVDPLTPLTDAVNNLAKIVEDSHSTIKKLSEDIKSLSVKVTAHDTKLSEVDGSLNSINSSVNELKSENDFLHKELNKLNLVLFGLDESSESEDNLLSQIVKLFADLTTDLVQIDCAYRIGNSKPNSVRPVKIRFMSLSHRNLIFSNRSKLPSPLTLKDDLPFEMRRNHAILHQKKAEAITSGVPDNDVIINFKHYTIKIKNVQYSARNGTLIQETPFLDHATHPLLRR